MHVPVAIWPEGVVAQRGHSANYYGVHPGNTPCKPPPYRSVHDPFKTASGVLSSGPWDPWLPAVENSRLFEQRGHGARCAPKERTSIGTWTWENEVLYRGNFRCKQDEGWQPPKKGPRQCVKMGSMALDVFFGAQSKGQFFLGLPRKVMKDSRTRHDTCRFGFDAAPPPRGPPTRQAVPRRFLVPGAAGAHAPASRPRMCLSTGEQGGGGGGGG